VVVGGHLLPTKIAENTASSTARTSGAGLFWDFVGPLVGL